MMEARDEKLIPALARANATAQTRLLVAQAVWAAGREAAASAFA